MNGVKMKEKRAFVETVKGRCRVCYTCVRECPVKAIRIVDGQADIIVERCINCGNCVKVCSQGAKRYHSSIDAVETLCDSSVKSVAMIAPSFPAEFPEFVNPLSLVPMVRDLGFDLVTEVAFGADLVTKKYKDIFHDKEIDRSLIVASCPAIISFVEYYHTGIIDNIAKIVSPMIAMSRVVRQKYGDHVKIVFIGPCIAKKAEASDPMLKGDVDEVLTFQELREMFDNKNVLYKKDRFEEFDPPVGGKGGIFPVTRGMLQSADMKESLMDLNVMVAEGKSDFPEIIKEFESGPVKDYHLDLLCCNGCIMGPGMSDKGSRFSKRGLVSSYVKDKLKRLDMLVWNEAVKTFSLLDLSREYVADSQTKSQPLPDEITAILHRMGKETVEDELNCEACGYKSCKEHAEAIYYGIAEPDMCLPYTIKELHKSIDELETTKAVLHQSEKLASMGQLAAGIAHEVNNPLGTVILYSHLLQEEVDKESDLHEDLTMIADHALRCKNIVSGLLNFSRKNDVFYKRVNIVSMIRDIVDEIVLSKLIVVSVESSLAGNGIDLDPDQMRQVFTNIIKNGVEAIDGNGHLLIKITGDMQKVTITIIDDGPGIKKEYLEKIFVPFFTTKTIGKGTGLGLSISYGIIKMHKGAISVTSNCDKENGKTGTEFRIVLPRYTTTTKE